MKVLLVRWLTETGSTRTPAVIRIGLAFILWLTWGDDFTLFSIIDLESLVVALLFYGATTAMLIGFFARASTLASGVVAGYIYYKLGLASGESRWVHHHTALLVFATLICALTPCGHSLSVDRWLARRSASRSKTPVVDEAGPLWAMRLWTVLVSVVYLGGAVSKSSFGWLSGDRLEQVLSHFYGSSGYPTTPWFGRLCLVATVSIVALEYALCVGLWFRRARRYLIPCGIALHFSFYVILPVETFSLTMLLLYLAFVPSAVDRFFAFASENSSWKPLAESASLPTIKERTIKGKTIKGKTIKGKTIKGKTIKGKTIKRAVRKKR